MLPASIGFKVGILANGSVNCLLGPEVRAYGKTVMANAVFDYKVVAGLDQLGLEPQHVERIVMRVRTVFDD
jgi:hypothetical protein